MNHICKILKQTNPYHKSFQSEFHSNLTRQVTKISKTKSNAFYQKSDVNIVILFSLRKSVQVYKVPKVPRNDLTYYYITKQTYSMTD